MRYYPISLSLSGARCLVVGAGRVGRRKIGTLLECGPALLLVVDPGLDEDAVRKAAEGLPCTPLQCERREFRDGDVEGMALVFAATPSPETNSRIAALCREKSIPCNVAGPVTDGAEGSFLVPAHIRRGRIVMTVSTEGGSPAFSRALKEELDAMLGRGYPLLADMLDALRPHVLALGLGSDADARIFRAVCARPLRDDLADALAAGDSARADRLLAAVLPPHTDFSTREMLHDNR